MGMILLILSLGLAVIGLTYGIYEIWPLKQFVDSVSSIDSEEDLLHFKEFVRRNMYAGLVMIGFIIVAVAILGFGFFRQVLSGYEILFWLAVVGPTYTGCGLWAKSIERRARSIPVSNAELKGEFDRVVRTWQKKPLPDW